MNRFFLSIATAAVLAAAPAAAQQDGSTYNNADFQLAKTEVRYLQDLDLLVFDIEAKGKTGATQPTPQGSLHNAPVLAYVFATSLKPTDVGFSATEGVVALAVTAHPDFDDTPLWDESNDGRYDNDGPDYRHTHWVVLTPDKRVAGGFSVKEFASTDKVTLPKTNPGMPMYMDSPGFSVIRNGNRIRVLVPAQRVNHVTDFQYDGIASFLRVNMPPTKADAAHGTSGHGHSDTKLPMLGVYQVYSIQSGNLSLPYKVQK